MQIGIKSIEDFFSTYKKAAWEKDVSAMINLYHEAFVSFDMWEVKGYMSGLEEWSGIIKRWLTSLGDEKVSVTFDRIDIQEGESIAFASALIQFQAIAPDQTILRSMRNRITIGLVKTDGFWKVKHQHTSAPIDSNLHAILNI